jgi:hypothetical protein
MCLLRRWERRLSLRPALKSRSDIVGGFGTTLKTG